MRDELSKKILYLENGVGFGGAVISLRTYLDHADLDRFPAVLAHSLDDPKFNTFAPGIKKVHLPETKNGKGLAANLARKANIDVIQYAIKIARLIRAEKVDCLYLNNDLVTNLSGMIAGRLMRIPVIQHERDIPSPISRLATSLCSHATRVLAISAPVRHALEGMGYPGERIRMVPEGLDLKLYQPAGNEILQKIRHELGVAPTDKMAVLVGMVMDWKGQHVLIDAAPAVLARYPDMKFVIVGESPPGAEDYAAKLREQVLRLGLTGKVLFSGYRSDVPAVMQAADIVVHASTSPEPFGRVVIEGMVMRTPVIATNIGAPPEIIRQGDTGYLVPPGEPAALARTMLHILDQPNHAVEVGENAHREVLRKYSIQRHAALIESVFEELFWGAPPVLASALTV